ncbi:hypothetical protein ABZX30_19545 [Streptomyces sp. NPDC004542]|uniref:hypothetical protein n=1 Tax=Streptomyces sp. NPDC004542 TaxID=3154281 RepID=UPI00339DF002
MRGPAVEGAAHEGPNVFAFAAYWMLVDEWHGLRVLHSRDLRTWERQGLVLDRPGQRADDTSYGFHADVVTSRLGAFVFYFTHPGRSAEGTAHHSGYDDRRSSIQVARLRAGAGTLVCDRDEVLEAPVLPVEGPEQ